MNNLLEFPIVNCITLETSIERHKYILEETKKYNLKLNLEYAYDGINNNIYDLVNIQGNYLQSMNNGEICTVLSHLRTIKNWLEDTSENYGFFCEDDVLFSLNENWNFTWDDFIKSLPPRWEVIQLALIREDYSHNVDNYTRFHKYMWDNWSACCYIMSKEYAKKLINTHCVNENNYNLNLPFFPNSIPYIENVLYSLNNKRESYTFPLFVENIDFSSTFYPKFIEQENKKFQKYSSLVIKKWWETEGKLKTLDSLIE
jgi:GR25 family glycosyltransferase involved in LPS biosynthesis